MSVTFSSGFGPVQVPIAEVASARPDSGYQSTTWNLVVIWVCQWGRLDQASEAWAQFKFHWHSGMHTGRTQTAAAARPGPDYESRSDPSLPVRQAIDQAPWAVRGWSGCSNLLISSAYQTQSRSLTTAGCAWPVQVQSSSFSPGKRPSLKLT